MVKRTRKMDEFFTYGPCKVPGCNRTTSRSDASPYCATHRDKLNRRGEVDQEPVKMPQINAAEARLRKAFLSVTRTNPTAAKLPEDFAPIVESWCNAILFGGAPSSLSTNRHSRRAAELLKRVGVLTTSEKMIFRVCAMILIEQENPRQFRSRRAFLVQLYRAVRQLAGATGKDYDRSFLHPDTYAQVKKQRRTSLEAKQNFAQWLIDAAAPFAAAIIHAEKEWTGVKERYRVRVWEAFAQFGEDLREERAAWDSYSLAEIRSRVRAAHVSALRLRDRDRKHTKKKNAATLEAARLRRENKLRGELEDDEGI
jgi:hypothetical protein